MKKIGITSGYKNVYYWSNEKGQGGKVDGTVDTKGWSVGRADWLHATIPVPEGKTVRDVVIQHLEKHHLSVDDLRVGGDGMLQFTTIENGEGEGLTAEQEERYENEGKQMYLCEYVIHLEVYETKIPTEEELESMFEERVIS